MICLVSVRPMSLQWPDYYKIKFVESDAVVLMQPWFDWRDKEGIKLFPGGLHFSFSTFCFGGEDEIE